MQNWDLVEIRMVHALDEVSGARAQVLAALDVQWNSPAGQAYRRRLEDCLTRLEMIPRELEGALVAAGHGRASIAEDGP